MMPRIGVAVMGLCLVLYLVVAGQRAIILLGSGEPVGVTMGAALLLLPLVGIWALVRELVFGFAAGRLGRQLQEQGALPDDDVTVLPSGRIVKEEAAPLLERYRREAAADDDWRAQYRLGVVQDAAGQRRDARASIRAAIRLERAARGEASR